MTEGVGTGSVAERLAALPEDKRALVERQLAMRSREPRTVDVSITQQGLWFLDQVVPRSPLYVLGWRIDLEGRLDPGALRAALGGVAVRHGALRTRFDTRDGRPVQVVLPEVTVDLPVDDLRDVPAAERPAAVERAVASEAGVGFDLAVAPLLRARLLRTGDDRWVLLVLVHHIVFDAASLDVFLADLAALYRAGTAGEEPAPAPPAVDYADFSRWQRRHLSGQSRERLLSYWREQLSGTPGVLELPIASARPDVQSFDGGTHELQLDGDLAGGVRALARSERATPFMVLLAAFKVLLLRYSGQDDVSVGSTVSGRTRDDLQSTIGFFLNTVVLRSDLSGDPTFRELLQRVRRTSLDAFAHQDMPFDQLVEDLRPDRTLGQNPLFQVSFDMVQEDGPAWDVPGLALAGVELVDVGMSKFDLSLTATDGGDGLHLSVEYSAELFEPEAIERLGRHYTALLRSIVADPGARIGQLGMLPAAERRTVCEEWNATSLPVDTAGGIHELVGRRLAAAPAAVALTHDGSAMTCAELDERANRLAHHLRDLGIGPGRMVGVCLQRSPQLVVAVLAVLRAGGAYVALDPGYPPERLAYVVDDAAAAVTVTESSLRGRLPAGRSRVVCLDDAGEAAAIAARPASAPPAGAAHPDALAYVVYTSGSTGRPKGAMNTHRNIVNQIAWVQDAYALDAGDCILHKTPLGFDDSVREIFWSLSSGARLAVAGGDGHRDPAYLAGVIERERVTVLHVVPSLLGALLDEPSFAPRSASLRLVICSGEVLGPQLVARFHDALGAELVNHYGPTEAAVDLTSWRCPRDGGPQPVPIGRPGANTRAYVVDPDGEPSPIGVPGELLVGGAQVGRGYLRRPGLTAERFVPDPFGEPGGRLYRTGDVCRWSAAGRLEYLGRTDDQIKLRGIRIELGEIETVLEEHPGVGAAVVVARDDAAGQQRLVAYVVPAAGSQAPATPALRAHLEGMLTQAMIPSAFVTLDALPLTSNGKVDRRALPDPQPHRPELESAYLAPRTALERVLAHVWSDVLEVERVGVADDFFELGGHSLMAARLAALATEVVGTQVPVGLVFRAPTIAGLAAGITARHPDGAGLEETAEAVLGVLGLSDEEVQARLAGG